MRGNLRAERARRNLTAKDVAEVIGCHVNQVYLWELGKTEPNTKHLMMLADLYKANPSYLLEEVEKCDK